METKFFLLFTNADLDLTRENRLEQDRLWSKEFHPFEFNVIDIEKKRYKVWPNCSVINRHGLYSFDQEVTITLLRSLKLLISLREAEKKQSWCWEREIKETFLYKLLFSVKQPTKEGLNIAIRIYIPRNGVYYDYKELHEIAFRWSESQEFIIWNNIFSIPSC